MHPVDWYAEHGVDLRLGETRRLARRRRGRHGRARDGRAAARRSGTRCSLRTLDDALELRAPRRSRRAPRPSIGGGFIGCEVTASLTLLGLQVTQIVRDPTRSSPRSQARRSPRRCTTAYRAHGVDLRLGATRRSPRRPRRRGHRRRARTSSSRATRASRCGAASSSTSGSRPRATGVYAIGDVAEFFDPLYRRHRRIEHWSNAAYHGTTLGQILAGDEDARYDIVSAFFSEEFGRSFKSLRRRAGHDSTDARGRLPRGARRAPLPPRPATSIAAVADRAQRRGGRDALKEEIRAGAASRRIAVTLAGKRPRGGPLANSEIEQLSIDTIRTLSMDAVQKANAGHPGTAMALAPLAYLLYTEVLRHNPANPHWPNRDRFVLSAGPRVHPAVLGAAPLRLRPLARGAEALPAVAVDDAGPSRVRAHRGHRDDDGPARPGLRERRRHGDRRALPRRHVQPAACTRSSTTAST